MSDAAGTQRAEVAPPKPMYEAVQITAADYNPALAFERAFDGSPFTTCPDWIVSAINRGDLIPTNQGHTDYARWLVRNGLNAVDAGPGDWIVCGSGRNLTVVRRDHARAIIAAIHHSTSKQSTRIDGQLGGGA